MPFNQFPLDETLLKNIADMGYLEPSPVQAQTIPLAIDGKDISGLSRTGTGKTAAFLIPAIHKLIHAPKDRICLCLSPTRELAIQIEEEAKLLAKNTGIQTVSVVGGLSAEDQMRHIRNGARLITGTPGRVIDLFKEGALPLGSVCLLVFDEADRMFDMGFVKDMQYILAKVSPDRQVFLFSATMNFSVLNMLYEYKVAPVEINVSRDQVTAENIRQILFHVSDNEKATALVHVCRKYAGTEGTIIVFVNYKERVDWIKKVLDANGIPTEGLSSLLRQDKRNKIITGFKSGKFRALVATDVASRGIDVDDVSLVVNFHMPEEAASYVHRIGRTARAGKSGIAVAICGSEDAFNHMRIEEFLGTKIPVEWFAEGELPTDVVIPSYSRSWQNDEGDSSMNDQERPQNRGRGGRDSGHRERPAGRNDSRGPRDNRGPRPPRNHDRPARAPNREAAPMEPGNDAPIAAYEAGSEVGPDVNHDAPRDSSREAPRDHRAPRENRGRDSRGGRDRGPRQDYRDRGPRNDRNDRGGAHGGDRGDYRSRSGRDRHDSRPAEPRNAEPIPPSPVTGNPIIYDMKTGKPKNRSSDEFTKVLADYEHTRKSNETKFSPKKKGGPALIKKLSSKVTALFGTKNKQD